jgi:potassium efflux system protein
VQVLTLSDRLVDRKTAVRETLDKLADATHRMGTRLLVPGHPPLWGRGLESSLRDEWPQVPQRLAEFHHVTRGYLELDARPFLLQGLFVVVLMFLFRHLPRLVQRRDTDSPMSESTLSLLSRPYAMALLLALLPSPAFHPAAPRRVLQALGMFALLPVARILSITTRRTSLLLYAGLFVLLLADRLAAAFTALPTISLLLGLFEVLLAFCLAFAYRRFLLAEGGGVWLVRTVTLGLYALGLSLLAELGGWSELAALMGRAVLAAGVTAVLLYAATISIEALVAFALASPQFRHSRFIDQNQDLVQRWSAIGVRLAGFVYWVRIFLASLGLTDVALGFLHSVLATAITVGALSISVGGVLSFVMTLVTVAILNRIVHEVLEHEIFPRTSLPRGIPHALLALSRYTIWSLGFLLALAAAGVEVGQLAIMLGGLGVGIGLGLQDVVKNFAAGITLMLERRVHVGDAVQIPDKDVFGRVLSIGIRASVIRNWNGTEVVMPNDDLVAGAVTNWTLSDRKQRLEVPVGVAYGTDPEAVIALLLQVASGADYLLRRPPPTALFKGFGESSLDFVLRGWTEEDYEQTGARTSQLGLAVHHALRDAGIEIPFPQRDVNLLNVSEAAAASLRGEKENP